jgi:hypothetical protein
MPVIIWETGTISKSFRKYLNNILGNHEIKELQKTAILGTAHILQKVLMSKYKIFIMGNNIICAIDCSYRIATSFYTLDAWFVSGIKL